MKPRLPRDVELSLPADVVWYIYKFVPHNEKPKSQPHSPQLEKDLRKIQGLHLKGMKGTYMRDLEDFLLD